MISQSSSIRIRSFRHCLAFLLLFLVSIASISNRADAQDQRTSGYRTKTFALTNANLVVAPGKIVENGTLVIENGLIRAVGKNVAIPADAERVDLKGKYVYAGFIDASTMDFLDAEKVPPQTNGRKVDFTRYVLAATRPDNRRNITPQYKASHSVKFDDAKLEKIRQAGFTDLHVLPTGRIASGVGTLLTTAGGPVREAILDQETYSQFELKSFRGSEYPSTLMGAFAHLRQALLDAQRHARHRKLYDDGAPGVNRPVVDDVLDEFNRVLDGKMHATFTAGSRDEIHRALDFAKEIKLNSIVLVGGVEAYRCLDRIKAENVPLILSIDFGKEPEIEANATSEKLETDIKEPLRYQKYQQEEWLRRVKSLQKYHDAGIPFAVASTGLEEKSELLENLRLAVKHGLSPEAALTALTVSPAKIFGQDRRMGTLEVGKLGHVVVMSEPFHKKESKVKYLFVDGHKFDYSKPPKKKKEEKEKDGKSGKEKSKSEKAKKGNDAKIAKEEKKEKNNTDKKVVSKIDQWPTELMSDRLKLPFRTGGNVLVKNATVITATKQTLLNTSVMIRNGKIVAIAKNLKPDEGMKVVDATGKYLMPGIIDTHSHIMITGGGNEGTQSVTPEVRIKDTIGTDSVSEYRALAGGTTAARIFHGSANVIGGQDAVVKLKFGKTAREHILYDAPQGVKFALGENVKRRETRFPNTRLGVEATLQRSFLEAVDYRRQWQEYERKVKNLNDKPNNLLPPRRDLRLEALADIVNHEKFIHSHCYRADEILMLLRVASDLGIRVWSLQHVLEGYKIAPEIAKHGASCSTFSDWWAYKVEAYDAIPQNASLLKEAGINVVIKSDSSDLIRHLALEAAKTVRYGNMHPDDAIQCVTLNAARELGLDKRMGSIEIGKDGDIALYSGHPLNPFARCEMTFVEGELYFSRANQPTSMSKAGAERSSKPSELTFPSDKIRNKKIDFTTSLSGRYAIVGATVHPVDTPDIANGTVLIANGKIAAVGKNVQIPSGTRVIDGNGLHVYPGMIDAGTSVGLSEIGSVGETNDTNESGGIQPDLRAGVGVNRDSELIPVARNGGITTIMVRPTGGLIAGQTSIVKLEGWTAPEMVMDLESGLQINWPASSRRRFGRSRRRGSESGTRPSPEKRIEEMEKFFAQAKHYDGLVAKAEQNKTRGPISDPRLDAMRPYLNGKKPVYIEANSYKAIAEALLFADKHKLKVVITGGNEAWKIADELKKRDVPVIVGPVTSLPRNAYDPFDSVYANAGRLYEAGVKFCIRSNKASSSRNVPFDAAMAVAYGLPEKEALRAVTLSSAEILGVADRMGSLTPGKNANLIISDGNILRQTTQIKGTFIEGKPFEPKDRQTKFYNLYRQRLKNTKKGNRKDITETDSAK